MNVLPALSLLKRPLAGAVLGLALLAAAPTPAAADPLEHGDKGAERYRGDSTGATPDPLLMGAWYSEFARRDRVIQLCVVVGFFALVVIMRKLDR